MMLKLGWDTQKERFSSREEVYMKRLVSVCFFLIMFFLVQIHGSYGQAQENPDNGSEQKVEMTHNQPEQKGDAKEENVESAEVVSTSKEQSTLGQAVQEDPEIDIMLVLDNSGSMKQNDPEFLTREVVTNFLNGLGKEARLGMVIFGREAVLAESLVEVAAPEVRAKFLKSLDKVDYKGQFTNSPAAIERAIYELKTHGRKDAQKNIIFLTDGIVDTGDKNQDLEKEKWLKEDLARESKKAGIRIVGIAFTDDADFLLIQTLAIKTDGEYFRAYKAADIQGVFEKINQVITKPPEKVDVSGLQEKADTPMPLSTPKQGVPIPLLIAGIIVIIGVVILFVVLKGRSKGHIQAASGGGPAGLSGQNDPPMPRAELLDVNSVISKEALVLGKKEIRIGREPHNDIQIPMDTVSSDHAVIEYKNGRFYLKDTRSSNGTSLNNKRIETDKNFTLKNGDLIKFDFYEFRFVLPDQAPAGKTKLAVQSPAQGTGTILRPSKPKDEQPGVQESQPQDVESANDNETRVKPGMCPNHPARKATELCVNCKKAFCTQCMTEKDGKTICLSCAEKL
jgi:pSer/pThr/pTyr-binding forkhead associated (FHA) protein/Mg-chelatase subunit ChlD